MTSVKDVGTGEYPVSVLRLRRRTTTSPRITDNVTPADNQTFTYDRTGPASNSQAAPTARVSGITYDSASNRTAYGATSYTYQLASNRLKKAGTQQHHLYFDGEYQRHRVRPVHLLQDQPACDREAGQRDQHLLV